MKKLLFLALTVVLVFGAMPVLASPPNPTTENPGNVTLRVGPQKGGKGKLKTYLSIFSGDLGASDVVTTREKVAMGDNMGGKDYLVGIDPVTYEHTEPVEISFQFDDEELANLQDAPAYWDSGVNSNPACEYLDEWRPQIEEGLNEVRFRWSDMDGRHIWIFFPNGRLRSSFQGHVSEIGKGKTRRYLFEWNDATFFWTPSCDPCSYWWYPETDLGNLGPAEITMTLRIVVTPQ